MAALLFIFKHCSGGVFVVHLGWDFFWAGAWGKHRGLFLLSLNIGNLS